MKETFKRWVDALPVAFFACITFVGVSGIFVNVRQELELRAVQQLAETEQGPEEKKMVEKASAWLGSKGLDRDLYLQCKADGECALTYTRAGVLHGATIRCYDKGCIAISGW